VIAAIAYPGVYMFGVSYACVYFAEGLISSGLTSVLFATFPFFVASLATWLLPEERLAGRGWFGLIIGFGGVMLISYDSLSLSGNLFLGTVLGIAAPLSSAYGVLLYKRKFADEQLLPVLIIQMIAGGIPLLLLAAIFESLSTFRWTAASIGSILYLAVPGTVVTFLGYFWLLKRIRVSQASLIAFITPIVALVVGVLLFAEPLRGLAMAGAALILTGVLLVGRH
jgi:drug/metabolite transporter (DMT)-like permease